MRFLALFLFIGAAVLCRAQTLDSLIQSSNSILKDLRIGDSLTYYQCHVEEVGIQLSTASGQTLTGSTHKCSITEKFVIIKRQGSYLARYYSSSLTDLPNRKFSGLKLREKPYWNFRKDREFTLTETNIRILMALERKGHEAIEYDFAISKLNTNQLIIRHKKNFKQLVIEGDYVLSRLLAK